MGERTFAQVTLLHPSFRNTIHGLYLSLQQLTFKSTGKPHLMSTVNLRRFEGNYKCLLIFFMQVLEVSSLFHFHSFHSHRAFSMEKSMALCPISPYVIESTQPIQTDAVILTCLLTWLISWYLLF